MSDTPSESSLVSAPSARAPRLAVCVKMVPGGDPGTSAKGLVVRSGPGRLNPHDLGALELARQIADALGVKADVLSMGPPAAARIVKDALAIAGGTGYLLTDPAFAGADSLATARTLAAALELAARGPEGPYDLIVCGPMTTDGGTGQVGPALAALTGRALIGRVESLETARVDGLIVTSLWPGERRTTEVLFPAVATVLQGAFPPRIPSAPERLRPKTVKTLIASDLPNPDPGLYGASGSATSILRTRRPPAPERRALRPTPEEAAGIILSEALSLD